MGVKIADGDSIAYWQTIDRDEFDGGPFIVRQPTPWDSVIEGEFQVVDEKRLPPPEKPA